MDAHPEINRLDIYLINKMKPVIVEWAERKMWDEIAFAIAMPTNYPEMARALEANMTLSEDGQSQLETWILTEYGMDCRNHRIQWAKDNYDRVFGIESELALIK